MQTVLYRVGEFVAHEWRFFVSIPFLALLAFLLAFVFTTGRILQWLVRLWPLSARLRFALGQHLLESQPAKAEAELQQAISLNPRMSEAYFLLANLQLDQKDRLDDAEQTIKEMLRQFPGHPVAYCLQGQARERRECYGEAEKSYRAANASAPEFAWPCSLLGALLRDKLHNPLGAEIAYRQAVRNQPGSWSNYYYLGNLMMQARRYGEAVKCYEAAVQKNRHDAPSQINLGLALVAAGHPEEAKKTLPRALRMRPRSPEAELGLGRLLRQLDETAQAKAAFRRAIDKDANLSEAYDELGRMLDEEPCNMGEAELVYRQGLEINRAHHELNYDLSLLLRRMHRHEEAMPFLQQALAADLDDFDCHMGLAAIFKRCGRPEQFAESIDRARSLLPCDEPYAAACLEAICDHPELALEHLKQAAQLTGFSRWWAWNDPDLECLRPDARFAEIVGPEPESEHPRALA